MECVRSLQPQMFPSNSRGTSPRDIDCETELGVPWPPVFNLSRESRLDFNENFRAGLDTAEDLVPTTMCFDSLMSPFDDHIPQKRQRVQKVALPRGIAADQDRE